MNSENIRLKAEARQDSIALIDMAKALAGMTKAADTCQKATAKAEQIGQDTQGLLDESAKENKILKKEVRKQKFLKWLAIIGIGAAVVLDRAIP